MKAEGQGGSSRSRQTSHFGGAAQWESRPEALRRRGRREEGRGKGEEERGRHRG